ncbi:hypothetical protein EMIT0357P_180044 [Pseudomonas marginalis]
MITFDSSQQQPEAFGTGFNILSPAVNITVIYDSVKQTGHLYVSKSPLVTLYLINCALPSHDNRTGCL